MMTVTNDDEYEQQKMTRKGGKRHECEQQTTTKGVAEEWEDKGGHYLAIIDIKALPGRSFNVPCFALRQIGSTWPVPPPFCTCRKVGEQAFCHNSRFYVNSSAI